MVVSLYPMLEQLHNIGSMSCMQGAFVLCRLFHKVDQKIDGVKYDEVDQTGDSPTTNKSSPDDTSSDLVQETATPEFQPERQSEGIKRWLTDKCDDVSHDGHVIGESCCNTHMTSDVEDHAEDNAIEVRIGLYFDILVLFLIALFNFTIS